MDKVFKFVMLTVALACVTVWARRIAVERKPSNANPVNVTVNQSVAEKAPEIVGIESDSHSQDSAIYQKVKYNVDPGNGAVFFSVDGSPVEGKLKAYLDAAHASQELTILVNHPDGESYKWVEIPMPLYLSLTDQAPTQ